MPHEWNASAYDRLPLPHVRWGHGVLERLAVLRPDGPGRLLDAGCGTGRDAETALARWPEVRLVGIDSSEAMLAEAHQRLGSLAHLERADLTHPLPVDLGPFDAVMSVAAFHWIDDHAALFETLAAAMAPEAVLVAECGGAGQLGHVHAAIADVTHTAVDPWQFAGVDATRDHLEAAGFDVLRVELRPDPLRLEDPALLERYLATVVLGGHVADLDEVSAAGFVREVAAAMPEPVIDYVRLEFEAVRR